MKCLFAKLCAAWLPSLPGHRFPPANIPIKMLTELIRLADRNHTASSSSSETDTETEEENSVPASPEQPEEKASSVVSWSASPTPEPPQRPPIGGFGLPPDSSLPVPSPQIVGSGLVLPPDSSPPRSTNAPKPLSTLESSPPKPVLTTQEHKTPSKDNESSEHNIDGVMKKQDDRSSVGPEFGSTSAPGRRDLTMDSDDDLEMSIPQALGEDHDIEAKIVPMDKKPTPSSYSSSGKSQADATILVEETPYVKGKGTLHPASNPQSQTSTQQRSSGTSKGSGSTRIVPSSYPEVQGPVSDDLGLARQETPPAPVHASSPPVFDLENTHGESTSEQVDTHDYALQIVPQMDVQPTPNRDQTWPHPALQNSFQKIASQRALGSTQISPNSSSEPSGHAESHDTPELTSYEELSKRKMDSSPEKGTRSSLKRRALDTSNLRFSQDPPIEDAIEKKKYAERKLLFTSREISQETLSEASTEGTPQHRMDKLRFSHGSPSEDGMEAMKLPNRNLLRTRDLGFSQETLSQDPTEATRERRKKWLESRRARKEDQTVFSLFKEKYPDYTGDSKHFLGICQEIHTLDHEKRAKRGLPEWRWDDYIVQNHAGYLEYAEKCKRKGKDPIEYYLFYKTQVVDLTHDKGVITDMETLERAIGECGGVVMGGGVPQRRSGVEVLRARSRSPTRRQSLPWAQTDRKAVQEEKRGLFRQSLPWVQGSQTEGKGVQGESRGLFRQSLPWATDSQTDRKAVQSEKPGPFIVPLVGNKNTKKDTKDTPQIGKSSGEGSSKSGGTLFGDYAKRFERLTMFTGEKVSLPKRTMTMKPPRKEPLDLLKWDLG